MDHIFRPQRAFAALLAGSLALALLALDVPAANAHPLPHGDEPRLVNLDPAPGGVVPAGTTEISVLAIADRDISDHEMRVNGEQVDASRGSGDHARISAEVELSAGRNDIEVSATTDHGTTERRWRILATDLAVDRIAGSDRVATAAAISRDLYPEDGSASGAVLARADDFPDALAGAPLAREVDGPLLLTAGDGLAGATRAELERVLADDATVYLLGGEGALSAAVESDVGDLGVEVDRAAGQGRYETAADVAGHIPETGTAFVASGDDFPDALAAAAIAGDRGWPILLTTGDGLPDAIRDYAEEAAFDEVHVVGGSGVVGQAVVDELDRLAGSVSRVAGANRFETAQALSSRFAGDADLLAVASGENFPDALAGGVHAAAEGAPLALVAGTRLFEPQISQVRDLDPGGTVVYGGGAAVHERIEGALRRASVDSGELMIHNRSVRDGQTVDDLDELRFELNKAVNLDESFVYATIGGDEVGGSLSHDGSADTLRFRVEDFPDGVEHGETYQVRVTLLATSGAETVHDEMEFTFRRPHRELARGASGEAVRDLQRTLRDQGYWLPSVNGQFDSHTHHAVVAFQKTHGLSRDGVVNDTTRRRLNSEPSLPSPRSSSGRAYEVNLRRSIVMLVSNGEVEWILDASAGHGQRYQFQGSWFTATTTVGNHRITRQINGIREAARGELYRPRYYDDSRGIAIHGFTSVPPHNASAGCIRVTNAAMDFMWDQWDTRGVGTAVHVYPEDYY